LEGVTVEYPVVTPANPSEADTPTHKNGLAMEFKSGQDSATTLISGGANNGEKARVVKLSGNESFKENPYTFLSSTDPILVSCMYISFPFSSTSS